MAIRNEDEYIFADAFIGCHVTSLMNRQDLIRLINCPDFTSSESLLREFGYGESKEVIEGDVEAFIRREQNKLFDVIFSNLTGREEMAPYIYPFDYHNIKVCIKSELLGITPDETYLISTGDINWMQMVAMIRDRNYEKMRPAMRDAVEEALDVYSRGGDPQEIDIILDKACYKDMADSVAESGSQFLVDYISMDIDTLNLKAFARLRNMEKPWSFFKKVFLKGGSLTEEFLVSVYEESYTQIADKLVSQDLKKALVDGGRDIDEKGDFVLYEKLLDNALMEVNRKAKFYSIGIEPIAGYWSAKEVELDNVRIILNGKLNGTDPDDIEELLRETYV